MERAKGNSDFVDLWKLKIPAKSAIFAWRLIKDRLPTKMNLIRRQVVVNDRLCPFCGLKDEEAEHLFFNCTCTLPLWWESISWANLTTTLPINPRDHFLQHTLGAAGVRNHTRWKCWWAALTWSIWNHRNKIVFQNHMFNGSRLMDDAVFVLWSWFKTMEKDFAVRLNQWSSNLKEAFTSLKINYAKSQFGIIGGRVNWVSQAAQTLNCRQLETPFCYLGIPVGAKPSSRLVWEPLINKCESKLM
ncbi:hypothetical protein GmHk_13G036206 [Glycine max]|nr:hypothetical protein GmHk_13G036206 [Glycine max]